MMIGGTRQYGDPTIENSSQFEICLSSQVENFTTVDSESVQGRLFQQSLSLVQATQEQHPNLE